MVAAPQTSHSMVGAHSYNSQDDDNEYDAHWLIEELCGTLIRFERHSAQQVRPDKAGRTVNSQQFGLV